MRRKRRGKRTFWYKFCKSAGEEEGEKSNEQALWLRHKRLKSPKNLNESSTQTQGVVCFYVLIPSKRDQAQSSFELANKTHLQQTECDEQRLLPWQHVLKWIVDRKQALIQKPTTVVEVDVCLPRGVSFYHQKVLWTHSAFEEFAPDTKLSLLIRWHWCYLILCFLVFKPSWIKS